LFALVAIIIYYLLSSSAAAQQLDFSSLSLSLSQKLNNVKSKYKSEEYVFVVIV
jgi:hypothetical protein